MTIEEVIKELKEYEDGLDLEYATPFDKAILYAIQALSQEPQCTEHPCLGTLCRYYKESCDDAITSVNPQYTGNEFFNFDAPIVKKSMEQDVISRDAFITRYREWMKNEYGKIPDNDTLAIRVIKSLPSVTQKSSEDMPCITPEEMQKCKDIVKKYTPKQEPCDDAVSRSLILNKIREVCFSKEWTQFRIDNGSNGQRDYLINFIEKLPSVTQKPTECDDTISRDAVKKVLSNHFEKHYYDYCDVLEEDIDKLPPVTPQTECLKAQAKKQAMPMSCNDCCYEPNSPFCEMYRKDICEKKDEWQSGKWIYEEVTRYEEDGDTVRSYVDKKCKCSACGHDYGYQCMKDPFCRYCGAKMESEENK